MKDIGGFSKIFYKLFIGLHCSNGVHTGLNEICWSITKGNVNNLITGRNVFEQEQQYSAARCKRVCALFSLSGGECWKNNECQIAIMMEEDNIDAIHIRGFRTKNERYCKQLCRELPSCSFWNYTHYGHHSRRNGLCSLIEDNRHFIDCKQARCTCGDIHR